MNINIKTTKSDSYFTISLGIVLGLLIISVLGFLYTQSPILRIISHVLLLVLPLLAALQLRLREFYLLVFSIVLVGLAYGMGRPLGEYLTQGLNRGAFLAAFILLMALLREGAMTSHSILAVGKYLTNQPPNRRFFSLFAGSHFFSVLINLGSLSLLSPIIQRGIRASAATTEPLDEISQIKERRQLSASLRGFAWFLVWAPTAVSQAVMPALIDGINGAKLMATGICIALLMMVVNWLEDSLRWRSFSKRLRAQGRPKPRSDTKFPTIAFRNIGLLSMALFGLSIFLSVSQSVSLVTGVMLASPIIVIIWVFVQNQWHNAQTMPVAASVTRLKEISFTSLPSYIRETVFIACAGFIGTMAAKLMPVGAIAETLNIAQMTPWLFLWCLSIAVLLLGHIGLSPITMAVFLGSIVAELPVLPTDPTWAALAIVSGTAICSMGAPFSGGILMMSRATGYGSLTLSWRWNGLATLLCTSVLAPVFWLLTTYL